MEDEPEQSLARALAEIPALDVVKQEPSKMGRYLPLALDGGRQEWAIRYNGELFADRSSLKPMGRDTARLVWPGIKLRFRFASGDPPDFRERRDGSTQSVMEDWLPVVTTRWLDREIEYTETAFVAPAGRPDEVAGDVTRRRRHRGAGALHHPQHHPWPQAGPPVDRRAR